MIESMLIILLIIAVIMMILSYAWESLTLSAVDTILWLILGIGIFNFEVPYQYSSGGTIIEATHTIESMYPIGWLFILMTFIMMIHTFLLAFDMLQGRDKKIM